MRGWRGVAQRLRRTTVAARAQERAFNWTARMAARARERAFNWTARMVASAAGVVLQLDDEDGGSSGGHDNGDAPETVAVEGALAGRERLRVEGAPSAVLRRGG